MALFIGGDFFSSGRGPFSDNGANDILIIDGKTVSNQEFQQKVNEQIGNNPVGQQQRDQVTEAVLNFMISEYVLDKNMRNLEFM